MRVPLIGLLALCGPAGALAQDATGGDAAVGAQLFADTCTACHEIENEAGEDLVEGETANGPNLYGVAGRAPGGDPEHYYTDMIRAYRDTGVVWEEENFVAFMPDPTAFLRDVTGKGGSSRMPHGMVIDDQQSHALWAYLLTFSPAEGEGAEGEASATAPAGGETVSD